MILIILKNLADKYNYWIFEINNCLIYWSDPISNRNGYYKRELDFIEKNAEYYGYKYKLGLKNGLFER